MSLEELKIEPQESARWLRIATIPEEEHPYGRPAE
jgi:hypothetical protein